MHVLVSAPGQIDKNRLVRATLRGEADCVGDRVARFERRDDALRSAERLESLERLLIGDGDVASAAAVLQVGVLRANARIVETGGDRVRLDHLAVLILQHVRARAMKDANAPSAERRSVLAA